MRIEKDGKEKKSEGRQRRETHRKIGGGKKPNDASSSRRAGTGIEVPRSDVEKSE